MIRKIDLQLLDCVIAYANRYADETFYFRKILETELTLGDLFGFFKEDRLIGIMYFSQTKAMIVHFEKGQVPTPVGILKAISHYAPKYIKGHTPSVASVYKIIYKTLKDEKITTTFLMAYEGHLLPINHCALTASHEKVCETLQSEAQFALEVERFFERKLRPMNELLKSWIEKSQMGEATFLIEENRFVGHGIIEEEGEAYGVIGGIYVSESYRGKGHGEHLSMVLTNRLVAKDKTPFLFVKENNEIARRLYEKIGYKCIERYSVLEFQR